MNSLRNILFGIIIINANNFCAAMEDDLPATQELSQSQPMDCEDDKKVNIGLRNALMNEDHAKILEIIESGEKYDKKDIEEGILARNLRFQIHILSSQHYPDENIIIPEPTPIEDVVAFAQDIRTKRDTKIYSLFFSMPEFPTQIIDLIVDYKG